MAAFMNNTSALLDCDFQRLENSGTDFSNHWNFPVCLDVRTDTFSALVVGQAKRSSRTESCLK